VLIQLVFPETIIATYLDNLWDMYNAVLLNGSVQSVLEDLNIYLSLLYPAMIVDKSVKFCQKVIHSLLF